jgi:hypothetical protein
VTRDARKLLGTAGWKGVALERKLWGRKVEEARPEIGLSYYSSSSSSSRLLVVRSLCMYVRTYVRMYTYMHTCIMYVCVCVCVYVCIYGHTHFRNLLCLSTVLLLAAYRAGNAKSGFMLCEVKCTLYTPYFHGRSHVPLFSYRFCGLFQRLVVLNCVFNL